MLRVRAACLFLLGTGALLAAGVRAQAPLSLVDDDTRVSRLTFRETDGAALDAALLQLQVATTGPGFFERTTPFKWVTRKGVYPLLPVEVARDAVRLERYYVRNGFPQATADYEVVLDSSANRAEVTFVVTHGPPLVIGDITFGAGGGRLASEALAADLQEDWQRFIRRTALRSGDRLDEFGLFELQNQTLGWLRQNGYAFADVGVERFVDDTGLRADVRLKLTPGPRARYDTITVEGLEGLPERIVSRELPFRSGERFDASQLNEGQREVFGLGLFQLALVDVVAGQPRDSTVDVSVRLRRGPTRVLTGFGGYYSDGGVTLRGQVTHRNFLGGARQASVGVEARTGLLGVGGQSVTGEPIRDLRASLSLRQPYFLDRRLSVTLQPSVRDRRDEIEASRSAELATTLLYTRRSLQTLSLTAAGRYRALAAGQRLRLLDPLGAFGMDTLSATVGALGADGTYGTLDSPLSPRRGFVLRPSVSVAAGDVSFGRARLSGTALFPFGRRAGIAARLTLGSLFAGDGVDVPNDYLLLRDQLFFAGGTADVRGWATARLGPKTLSVIPGPDDDLRGPGDVTYVGTGARRKVSGSVQLNLPLPIGPQWGANLFIDGGGLFGPSLVPTAALLRATGNATDASFADVLDAEGGLRVGTGAGLQYLSPVGYISVAIGVKINPSDLDLRAPGAVLCGNDFSNATPECTGGYVGARLAGVPFDIDDIDVRPIAGRLQIHFSIGQSF